jgi:hypothetical protein
MMQLELDRILEYLLTGEDGELVVGVLPLQQGAASLLSRAEATLQLVGGDRMGPEVRERLDRLRKAIDSEKRRSEKSRSSAVPRFEAPASAARYAPMRESLEGPLFQRDRSGSIESAVFGSESGMDELRAVRLRDDRFEPFERPDGLVQADDTVQAFVREALPRFRSSEASSYWMPFPGGGRLELQVTGGGKSRALTVRILEAASGIPVTWLPREGVPVQVLTDKAGRAVLPLPGAGSVGTVRIDAERTLLFDLHISL